MLKIKEEDKINEEPLSELPLGSVVRLAQAGDLFILLNEVTVASKTYANLVNLSRLGIGMCSELTEVDIDLVPFEVYDAILTVTKRG